MKRRLSTLLAATLILASLTACGKESEDTEAKALKSAAEKPASTTTTSKNPAAQTPTTKPTATPVEEIDELDVLFGDPLPERSAYAELTEPVAEEPWVDRQVIDRSNPDVAAALEAYKAVFNNSKNFSFTYDEELERYKENMSLSELIEFFSNHHNAPLSHFALIDLDRDNVPEIVLALGYYRDSFVILHYHDERVNAFHFYIRSFNSLKADGTFLSSSGAMENYHSKITFIGNTYAEESYTHGHSFDVYYVYGQKVTKEEYTEAFNKEESKPKVTWYEYSDENIKKLFP